MHVYQFFAIT